MMIKAMVIKISKSTSLSFCSNLFTNYISSDRMLVRRLTKLATFNDEQEENIKKIVFNRESMVFPSTNHIISKEMTEQT